MGRRLDRKSTTGKSQTSSTKITAPYKQQVLAAGQFIGVAGVDFDEDGNLWFSNAYTSNGQLQVRKSDGSFRAFNFQPQLNATVFMGEVLATREGYIWGILPRGNGLVVFDHAGTIDDPSDDSYRVLTNQPGQGGLPNMDIYAVEEDLNGEIWVGTLQGIAVFYAPQAIFSEEGNFDAQQILIEQDGNIQILLETEQINCITIDGANRKWIGTGETDGVCSSSAKTDKSKFTISRHATAPCSPTTCSISPSIMQPVKPSSRPIAGWYLRRQQRPTLIKIWPVCAFFPIQYAPILKG